ncbi:hypothetical protein [Burkholderia sp. F1]|uniref:hypothetical protein n=1 Tax=Burkholderia sp. F1 TaxID=3366817 RepID=UPI003D72F1E1
MAFVQSTGSPLGCCVSTTERVRNAVRVQLDIASHDFDFSPHALIATLPQAPIGRISRRAAKTEAC